MTPGYLTNLFHLQTRGKTGPSNDAGFFIATLHCLVLTQDQKKLTHRELTTHANVFANVTTYGIIMTQESGWVGELSYMGLFSPPKAGLSVNKRLANPISKSCKIDKNNLLKPWLLPLLIPLLGQC